MKNYTKNYLFSNFDMTPSKGICKGTKLSPVFSKNFKLDGTIRSVGGMGDFLEKLFGEEKYNLFLQNNVGKIGRLIYIDNVLCSGNYKIIFLSSLFELFELNQESMTLQFVAQFSSFPQIVHHQESMYIFDEASDVVIISAEDTKTSSTMAKISEAETYLGIVYFKVYGRDYNVYYCADLGLDKIPAALEKYSSFSLDRRDGKILKIIYLKSQIYVFQQRAISCITSTAKAKKITLCAKISSDILENTICVQNNQILFLSRTGLFTFGGSSYSQLSFDLSSMFLNNVKSAVSSDGQYYVLSKLEDSDTDSLSLVAFDTNKISQTIFSADDAVSIFLYVQGNINNVVLVCETPSGTLFRTLTGSPSESDGCYLKFNKFYPYNGMGVILSKVRVNCVGSFMIKLTSELGEVNLQVNGNSTFSNIGLRGHGFLIEIFGNSIIEIESILIETITNYKKA